MCIRDSFEIAQGSLLGLVVEQGPEFIGDLLYLVGGGLKALLGFRHVRGKLLEEPERRTAGGEPGLVSDRPDPFCERQRAGGTRRRRPYRLSQSADGPQGEEAR